MQDWLAYLWCVVKRGHWFDAVVHGRPVRYKRRRSRVSDTPKTRCVWCTAERFVYYLARHRYR